MNWVKRIEEQKVHLAVHSRILQDLPEYKK